MLPISELKQLKGRHFIAAMLGFSALIGPGFLLIYRYHPELIEKYDVIKLLIFSLSLTMPVFISGFVGARMVQKKAQAVEPALLDGAVTTACALYTAISLSYFLHYHFWHVELLAIGLILGTAAIDYFQSKKKEKGSTPTPPSENKVIRAT